MRTIALRLLGALVITAPLVAGALDVHHGVLRWSELGPLPPGKPVPAMRVLALDGAQIDERDLRGRITVLTFWATWCPACRMELEDLDTWFESGEMDEDVAVLAVNLEGNGHMDTVRRMVLGFRSTKAMSLPMALGTSNTAKAFGVGPIPHTVIIDRDGVIRRVHQGRVSVDTLREEIAELR